jgi:hypothetical protein
MGGVYWDIVAVDRTKEAIDSAINNIDEYEAATKNSLTSIIDSYGTLALEVGVVMLAIQQGYDKTIGSAVTFADSLENMHYALGVSNADVQTWRQVSVETDTSLLSITTTMRYLTQRISESGEQGDKLRATLKNIGVDAKDAYGNYKDANTLYLETVEALGKIPAGTERATDAAQLLGRNWYTVAKLIDDSEKAIETFKKSQPMMSDKDLAVIDQYKVKVAEFNEQLTIAQAHVGVAGIDLLTETENGTKIWANILSGNVIGLKQVTRDMQQATADINAATEKAFAESLKTSDARLGQFVSMGSGPSGTTIGLYKQAAHQSVADMINPYGALDDTAAKIKLLKDETIPSLTTKWQEAVDYGKDVAKAEYDLAAAYRELKTLQEKDTKDKEKERTDALVSAYKEEEAAIKKLNDAKKAMYDADQEYYSVMQNAGTDVAAARQATQSRRLTQSKALYGMSEDMKAVNDAKTEFNAIKSGIPLEQIKGTDQYTKAQATTIQKLVIENITLSPDYTANDFMNDLTAGRIAKGMSIQQQRP